MRNLKFKIAAISAGLLAIASASAQTFGWNSSSANSAGYDALSGTNAIVIFRSVPSQQIRIATVICSADTNTATLNFYTGTTPHYIAIATNPAVGSNIVVESTVGFSPTNWVCIEPRTGSPFLAPCYSTNNATNLVLRGTIPQAVYPGDQVYVLSAATTLPIVSGSLNGATNLVYTADALYVGSVGRPAIAIAKTPYQTNWISTISAKYELP